MLRTFKERASLILAGTMAQDLCILDLRAFPTNIKKISGGKGSSRGESKVSDCGVAGGSSCSFGSCP
jgi:hypothetical protein